MERDQVGGWTGPGLGQVGGWFFCVVVNRFAVLARHSISQLQIWDHVTKEAETTQLLSGVDAACETPDSTSCHRARGFNKSWLYH